MTLLVSILVVIQEMHSLVSRPSPPLASYVKTDGGREVAIKNCQVYISFLAIPGPTCGLASFHTISSKELGGVCHGNIEYLDPLIVSRNNLRVGYRVRQGFVSRNTSRNTHGRVQGEVLLVLLISCSNKATCM